MDRRRQSTWRALPKGAELTTALKPQLGGNGAGFPFIIRPGLDEDIEIAARIIEDAFYGFYETHRQEIPFHVDPDMDVPTAILQFKKNKPDVEFLVAVRTDGEGNELEVIGSNAIDLRDHVAGVGVLSVRPDTQSRGTGKALMKAVMDIGDKEATSKAMCLMVDAFNFRGFALYSSLGFETVEFCTMVDGFVPDYEEERVLKSAEASGVTVRRMSTGDVQNCDDLFLRTFGVSRINGIRDSPAATGDDGFALVATRVNSSGDDVVVGYMTAPTTSGHWIAENEDIMKVLIASSSRIQKSHKRPSPISLHMISNRDPALFRWALKSGLQVKGTFVWMRRGGEIAVPKGMVYSPDNYY